MPRRSAHASRERRRGTSFLRAARCRAPATQARPVLTSSRTRSCLAGAMRLRVPSWSSFPQRPQLLNSLNYDSTGGTCEPGFPIWTQFGPLVGAERAAHPPVSSVALPNAVDGSPFREVGPEFTPFRLNILAPAAPSGDTSAGSKPAPHRPRTKCAARDQVRCHVSRSMRPRICPNSRCVKCYGVSCQGLVMIGANP